jgi:hypothetical protein
MQVTISLGLEELKLLPEELRQKIQSSLGLPVVTPQRTIPEVATSTSHAILPVFAAPEAPQAVPAFALPVQQMVPPASMPAPPAKQPVVQNGVPTFMPSKGGLDQQSVAVDVLSNQPVTPATPPSAPVMPQFNQAPLTVAPVTTGVAAMAPITGPAIDAGTVRAAAIRAHNSLTNGKAIVAAAQAASGVSIAGLTNENASLLANALRQQGVNV